MNLILLDENAAKELLEALGHEWVAHKFTRVHRLLALCASLNPGTSAFGHGLRANDGPDILASVRVIHLDDSQELLVWDKLDREQFGLAAGGGKTPIIETTIIGAHDATVSAEDSRNRPGSGKDSDARGGDEKSSEDR